MADNKKRARAGSDESDLGSPGVKSLRCDLLDIVDEAGSDPATRDLDSVIKNLEEELTSSPSPAYNCIESGPDLGYLLEASDDELGLPPPPAARSEEEWKGEEKGLNDLIRLSSESSGTGEFWEFEDQILSYDSFDMSVGQGNGMDYVALDGLFEYSDDVCFDSSVLRQETVPAE